MTIRTIYSWFYCLPIFYILCLLLIVTAGYLYFQRSIKSQCSGYIGMVLLLIGYFAVILSVTLTGRSAALAPIGPELIPFHSYYVALTGGEQELLRSNFMNIILFYPAGLLGYGILPTCWSQKRRVFAITAFCALFSIGIEACQYYFALGQAETDDVIHNTLGAWIGATVCTLQICKRR